LSLRPVHGLLTALSASEERIDVVPLRNYTSVDGKCRLSAAYPALAWRA
jgi:hypothetical protein